MRRHAIIGALLLVGVGVILGATVFRTDIAQATGLKQSQSVIVDNTAGDAVPVREQNLDAGNVKVHEQSTVSVRSADQEVSATAAASANLSDTCGGTLYSVPPGKQLVVKYISAFGSNAGATSGVANITADSSQPIGINLPVVLEKQYIDEFSGSESVNYVVPPGTEIHFLAAFAGATQCSVRFALGGVLQPVP